MALRNVVKIGEDTLLKKTKIVEKFDKNLWQLLDDMADTMYKN
ncbi:MAG: peptide deformylase, partial [Clostridia bacterium]|nr:peptide deformylase [Clostridia bacterium]